MTTYTIKIRNRLVQAKSLKDCRAKFSAFINETSGRWGIGLGASDLLRGDGDVCRNGNKVGHFSYNLRFWRIPRAPKVKGMRPAAQFLKNYQKLLAVVEKNVNLSHEVVSEAARLHRHVKLAKIDPIKHLGMSQKQWDEVVFWVYG